MRIVIATKNIWNLENAQLFQTACSQKHTVQIVDTPSGLTNEFLEQFAPDYIFFPHWSDIIPERIYSRFECVVFHMADLPFGRGGSPLQNLIARGIYETKISALRVVKELDAGPVYLKHDFSLKEGTAEQLYRRASEIIFHEMIPYILEYHPVPKPQEGEPVSFKRRKPRESELQSDMSVRQLYDFIRMLDAQGYPAAFIAFGEYRLQFHNAKLEKDVLTATVTFHKEEKNEKDINDCCAPG